MESRKMALMKLFSGQQWRHKHWKQYYGHGIEEEEEGRIYAENNMETYFTISKIDNQWEFAVWLRELKPGLNNNIERCDKERDQREVQKGGNIRIPMANSCWYLAERNTIL